MKRTVILAVAAGLSLAAGTAAAQYPTPGTARGFGLGVAAMLPQAAPSTPHGLSLAYDAGRWHLDTMLSARGNGDTTYSLGVRGWFHLHQTPGADFSVGGGLGIAHHGDRGPGGDDENSIHLDAGFLVRAFLTPSVALSAFGGLGIVPGESAWDGFALDGQLGGFGGFGLHYFFD
jgi:opacity protein-like surface antigen